MNREAHGFTIVELLIVIVVIAILAAISVAAYVNIQERARFSAMLVTRGLRNVCSWLDNSVGLCH